MRKIGQPQPVRLLLVSSVLLFMAAGCATPTPPPTVTTIPVVNLTLPGANAIGDWTPTGEAKTYNPDNLFNLVDGQAEAFFVYGFEQVTVRRYKNAADNLLNVEVWQLSTFTDAYGLFTLSRAGMPASVGNESDADPGRRLTFWQNRYYAAITANKKVADADLTAFAKAVSAALPSGGERPALVARLPQNLTPQSFKVFHEEISIQDEVWLGGKNILGLSHETVGVLAKYDVGGVPARLLLVEYSRAEQALTGFKALQDAAVVDLVASNAQGNLLGAVVGKVDQAAADALLQAALK